MNDKLVLAKAAIEAIVLSPGFQTLVKEDGATLNPKESLAHALLLVDALIKAFGLKEDLS